MIPQLSFTYPTTSKEPENNQHLHVRCQSTSDREDEVPQVASMIDVQTAVKLAERCDQDGTESEAKEVAVQWSA